MREKLSVFKDIFPLNIEFFSAWRKERLVYTMKAIVFASATGNDVVDVIPFAELVAIRNPSETAAQQNQRCLGIDEDEVEGDDIADPQSQPKAARSTRELTLETEPAGYNSGRTYRVECIEHIFQ